MTDTQSTIPAAVGAKAVFDGVGDDLLHDKEANSNWPDGRNPALIDGQPCTLLEQVGWDNHNPYHNVWRVRAGDGNEYPVFEGELTIVDAAPINDPSAYSAPLL